MKLAALAVASTLALLTPAVALAQGTSTAAAPASPEQQKAEAAIRKTIDAFVAGKPNTDDMEGPLVEAVAGQASALGQGLASLGAVKAVDFQRAGPQGTMVFKVTFANGALNAAIAFGTSGKINTLWFKPAT